MSTFITRVELHKADDKDYEVLHASMETQGFKRTIVGSSGKIYKMPTAEYMYDGQLIVKQVFDKAEIAAKTTKKGYWIITTQSSGQIFTLEEVK